MKLKEIFTIDDQINVVFKETSRKKARERVGKVISVNDKFLTVNFGKYTESLDVFKMKQGFIKVAKCEYVLSNEI